MRRISSVGARVGYDGGSAVSEEYQGPFAYTGRYRRLDIDVDPYGRHHPASDTAEAETRTELSRQKTEPPQSTVQETHNSLIRYETHPFEVHVIELTTNWTKLY